MGDLIGLIFFMGVIGSYILFLLVWTRQGNRENKEKKE
jgi:hypothetical protein